MRLWTSSVEPSVHACSAACSACQQWLDAISLLGGFQKTAVTANVTLGSIDGSFLRRIVAFRAGQIGSLDWRFVNLRRVLWNQLFQFFFRNLSFQRIAYNAVMAAGEDSTKFHWNVAVSLFNDFGSRALIADSTSYNILSSSCGDLAFKCQLGVIAAMNLRSIRLFVYTICSINMYIYIHLL